MNEKQKVIGKAESLLYTNGPVAHMYFTEEQLTDLLKHLPKEDTMNRPYLQKAGENIFGWRGD